MSGTQFQDAEREQRRQRRHHARPARIPESVDSFPISNPPSSRQLHQVGSGSILTGPSQAFPKRMMEGNLEDGESFAEPSGKSCALTPKFHPVHPGMEEETSSKRSRTTSKRTSILSTLFFPVKSERIPRAKDETTRSHSTTSTKLKKRATPPPSPGNGFSIGFRKAEPTSTAESLPVTHRNSVVSVPASDKRSSRPSSGVTESGQRDSPISTSRKAQAEGSGSAIAASIPTQTLIVHDGRTVSRGTIKERRSSRHSYGMQDVAGTPGGTVPGISGMGQQSRPALALLRRLSKGGLNSILNAAGQGDFIRTDDLSRDPSSASSRKAPLTPADTVYTQGSGHESLTMEYVATDLTSALPSSAANMAASFDFSPALVTPQLPLIPANGSDGVITSISITSSSSPSKRPNLNRTRAYREDRRDELLRRLNAGDQRAVEALIDAEAVRKCRQALIDIEEDTVFAKAMAQVMKKQFPASLAEETFQAPPLSPHQSGGRPELQKDAIKASFLVREILRGERSYSQHLKDGITVRNEPRRERWIVPYHLLFPSACA